MIFVTVGTHEQPFDRLIRKIDELKESRILNEEIIVQSGYSTYEMKFCKQFKFLSYNEMKMYIKRARIIITHGGPASFIMAFQDGKIPVVVPRQKRFGEHVNNHQFEFIQQLEERSSNIIPVYDIDDLQKILVEYEKIVCTKSLRKSGTSNNLKFNKKFECIIKDLLPEK